LVAEECRQTGAPSLVHTTPAGWPHKL
jgi:hypothetical protein